ncbi:MAG: amino acid adenylation domain-containing protein [Planctomycetota bacterium]
MSDPPIEPWSPRGDAPPISPGEVHVWLLAPPADDDRTRTLDALLDASESARANALVSPGHRAAFISAHGQAREVLASYLGLAARGLEFVLGPGGKPCLADRFLTVGTPLRFNLTHSGETALLAVALGREVGVDVECMRHVSSANEIARRHLAPEAATGLERLTGNELDVAFLAAWTRHEALLKAQGRGLFDEARPGDDRSWEVVQLDAVPGLAAAVAFERGPTRLRTYTWTGPARARGAEGIMPSCSGAYLYNLGLAFEDVVRRAPGKTALWFSRDASVSYGDLNALANRAARRMQRLGLGAGDVAALFGVKLPVTFACILGCLKLGVPYCVLDPDSPGERLDRILSRCRPRLVLGPREVAATRIPDAVGLAGPSRFEDSTDFLSALASESDSSPRETAEATGESPAYIMFTSGSTGFPKGAVMTHGNVLNLIAWARQNFDITPQDVLTNVNPLYFDNSVFDIYSSWFNGASLVPFTKQEVQNPRLLVERVEAAGCTSWFSVPSLLIYLQTMGALDGRRMHAVRKFIFAGEGFPKARLKQLYDLYSASSTLFNCYGPTECTCLCSSHVMTAADFSDMSELPPLGRMAPNVSCLILNQDGQPSKEGEFGELCLMGPLVGRGYYDDPDRTTALFVQNPLQSAYREIMYRTGDLVMRDPATGLLQIRGRVDNQIKHMGHRIELEDIESALHRLDFVSEAAVLHSMQGGTSRLLAVVSSCREFSDAELRSGLKRLLPDYMIPTAIHRMPSLPKNANGKVDRLGLAQQYCRPPDPSRGA